MSSRAMVERGLSSRPALSRLSSSQAIAPGSSSLCAMGRPSSSRLRRALWVSSCERQSLPRRRADRLPQSGGKHYGVPTGLLGHLAPTVTGGVLRLEPELDVHRYLEAVVSPHREVLADRKGPSSPP